MPLIRKHVHSYPLTIFVAGDIERAKLLCREFCDAIGWCVTVTPTTYVYRGSTSDDFGNITRGDYEDGVMIGIINYAKYPQHPAQLWDRAEHLAEFLVAGLYQHSCSIQGPSHTVHYEFGQFWEIEPSWKGKTFDGPDHTLASEGEHLGLTTFYVQPPS